MIIKIKKYKCLKLIEINCCYILYNCVYLLAQNQVMKLLGLKITLECKPWLVQRSADLRGTQLQFRGKQILLAMASKYILRANKYIFRCIGWFVFCWGIGQLISWVHKYIFSWGIGLLISGVHKYIFSWGTGQLISGVHKYIFSWGKGLLISGVHKYNFSWSISQGYRNTFSAGAQVN